MGWALASLVESAEIALHNDDRQNQSHATNQICFTTGVALFVSPTYRLARKDQPHFAICETPVGKAL
jgi:hypothetical protein